MRRVRYADFRQAVRRHAPSEILAFLSARAAAKQPLAMGWDEEWAQGYPPWVYAAIAREAILYGNEYRRAKVDEEIFRQLRNLMTESHDAHPDRDGNPVALLGGYAYEQFPYQTSIMEEIARPYLLMTSESGDRSGQSPTEGWERILGGTIDQALGASFIFYVGVMRNGFFDPRWFDEKWFDPISEVVPVHVARAVLNLLTATVDEAKEDGRAAPALPAHLQRFAYNPLIRTPLIDLGDGPRHAPQPQFILRAISTENLYYRGIREWAGANFAGTLGMQVQDYTGRQLRHTGRLEVIEEFRWHKNKTGGIDSSDWFLITPQLTILIECKSARMSMAAKAGSTDGLSRANAVLGKAYKQLKANADEIRSSNPAYSHIPSDRPLMGFVVTVEPFYMANAQPVRATLPDPGMPVLTVSLREIEKLSVLEPTALGDALHRIIDDPELYEWQLSKSLEKVLPESRGQSENALILDAYERTFLPLTGRTRAGDRQASDVTPDATGR